jgi:transcriptional regulator with XRE-family HTH domain
MGKSIYSKERNRLSAMLVQAREEAGFTQAEVANTGIIKQSKLSKIENGQQKLDILLLGQLSELYKKSISFFLRSNVKDHAGLKDQLYRRYGKCMITGCDLSVLLSITSINRQKNNDIDFWLILRSDICTLYELNAIAIDPYTLKVHVKDVARQQGYEVFHGMHLFGCTKDIRPNKDALKLRWKTFNQT